MNNKLISVEVNNLFGFLKHSISLRDEGVTFIHGPNGCGKTTLLKLIAAFYEWNVSILFDIEFEELILSYSSGNVLNMLKTKKLKQFEEEKIEIPTLTFTLHYNDEVEPDTFIMEKNLKQIRVAASEVEDYIPFLRRVETREWIDVRTGEHLSYYEVIEKFSHRLPFSPSKKRPEWLQQYQEKDKLHFVQTQRLLKVNEKGIRRNRSEESAVTEVIQLYSDEIKEKISMKLAESAAVSQSKDRSFPERLLSIHLDDRISEDSIRNDYKSTEDKIQKLMATGLIDQEKNISLPQKKLEATEKKVLSLYLQDINEKLSIFDELQVEIETYLNIVSPKLRNKVFRIDRKNGFVFQASQGNKGLLHPTQLSSGEQHQIVLFYELIFKTKSNSLLLIDEPEISLHVDWQRSFLDDISQIAQLGNHSFIIATHSPQIIGNRRDLAIALDGGILSVQ